MMNIHRRSPITGQINTMELDVTPEQLARWRAGELIQNVFPYLSDEEREFIMTGLTPEDWASLFPVEDDEDEPY